MNLSSELNLYKDMDGNYILKQYFSGDEHQYDTYLKNSGVYTGCLLVSTKSFNKKLKHSLDDIVKEIERGVLSENFVQEEDLIFERFTLSIKDELEFNPLFKKMSEEEVAEYTKNSKKVHIEIKYEIHMKPKSHLVLSGIINSLMNFKK